MDPNGIVGTPTEREVWLAPDWSSSASITQKQPSGYTRVKVRTVLYNDGRRVTYVLDKGGKPVAPGGAPAASLTEAQPLSEDIDKDQQTIWTQRQAPAQRGDQEGDVRSAPASSPIREVFRGGKWVTEPNPIYQAPGSADWHTEGTPDGQGGHDNTRPIMVRTVNGKREERAPNATELKDWNEAQQRGRNPGGKTDKEVQDEQNANAGASNTTAVKGSPGWTQTVTQRRNPQTGVDETTTVYNGPGGVTSTTPPSQTTSNREPVKDHPGVYLVSTTKDGKSETHFENEAGQTIQAPPNLPASIVSNGTTFLRGPDGTYAPAKGVPGPANPFSGDETGAPPLGNNREEITRGLQSYSSWLATQVKLHKDTNGAQGIAPQDASAKMEQRIKIADAVMRAQGDAVTNQTGLRGQDVTQRGQTLNDQGNRRSNSASVYNNTVNRMPEIKYVAPGSAGLLATAMAKTLNGGTEYAGQWGGMDPVPEVGYQGFPDLQAIRQGAQTGINTAAQGGPQIFAPQATPSPAAPAPAMTPEQQRAAPFMANPATTPAFLPSRPTSAADAAAAQAAAQATQQQQAAQTPPPVPAVNPINQAPIAAPPVTPPGTSTVIQPRTPAAPTAAPQPATPGMQGTSEKENRVTPPAPAPDHVPSNTPGTPGYDPSLPMGLVGQPQTMAQQEMPTDAQPWPADPGAYLGARTPDNSWRPPAPSQPRPDDVIIFQAPGENGQGSVKKSVRRAEWDALVAGQPDYPWDYYKVEEIPENDLIYDEEDRWLLPPYAKSRPDDVMGNRSRPQQQRGQPDRWPGITPPTSTGGNVQMAPGPQNPVMSMGRTPRFVQQARYGQSFDPQAAGDELALRLGISPEIMAAAVGSYG